MALVSLSRKAGLYMGLLVLLSACASSGPKITVQQSLTPTAKTPYNKILVISLFSSFDTRRYLETEVVKAIKATGSDAVASTSMMDSRTPSTRETFVAMVDKIGADAALVTQVVSLDSVGTVKDMRPEATRTFRPTYYYNVWSYELAEYVEPPSVAFDVSLAMASQVLSVEKESTVWAIESNTDIYQDVDQGPDYKIFISEAKGIVDQMSKDGLIGR